MGCKRYDGCISRVLFQISWHLQTQTVKNRILSDSVPQKITAQESGFVYYGFFSFFSFMFCPLNKMPIY